MPLAEALHVLLGLLRDSGAPQRVVAQAGQYQQSLPAGKSYHLMRVRVNGADGLVPEISGHRLMVMVDRPQIEISDLPPGMRVNLYQKHGFKLPLAEVETDYIRNVLNAVAGNKTRAAKLLGLPNYQTLDNWLKKYGFRPHKPVNLSIQQS
jgi:hypothetical protein